MDMLAAVPKVYFPGAVYFGKSSLLYLRGLAGQRNLVVISKTVQSRHGERIQANLSKSDNVFLELSSEPRAADVQNLKGMVLTGECENVIGIGGGSVMDLAKTAKLANPKVKLIMVPTTPGTGSEASRYSLIMNENGEKEVLSSESMVPDAVLLDPGFLSTLAAFDLACASADALSHAFEGLVSRMSCPFTDSLAIKAIDMVFESLERACSGDAQAVESIQIAGFLAGMVQSSASVGIIHSFAHYFGPKAGIPHGAAVGMFLVSGLKFNSQRTDKYGKLDSSCRVDSGNFVQKTEELLQRVGFYKSAGKFGIPEFSIEEAAARIKSDACTRTNPCPVSESEIISMIEGMEWKR